MSSVSASSTWCLWFMNRVIITNSIHDYSKLVIVQAHPSFKIVKTDIRLIQLCFKVCCFRVISLQVKGITYCLECNDLKVLGNIIGIRS